MWASGKASPLLRPPQSHPDTGGPAACSALHAGVSCLPQTPGTDSFIQRQSLLSLVAARGPGVHPSVADLGRAKEVEGSSGFTTMGDFQSFSTHFDIFWGYPGDSGLGGDTVRERRGRSFFNQIYKQQERGWVFFFSFLIFFLPPLQHFLY